MKLPQNPLLRQVHRFRESLLLLLYYSLSFLGVRWMRTGHPRVAAVWSCGFVAELGAARYGPGGAYAGAGPAGCGGAPCSC